MMYLSVNDDLPADQEKRGDLVQQACGAIGTLYLIKPSVFHE
jgi:hypothetical protein